MLLDMMCLCLLAEQEELERQKNDLVMQHSQCIQELCCRARKGNDEFGLPKKKGFLVITSWVANAIEITMVANAIEIPKGAPGHDMLHQIRVHLKDAAAQRASISEAWAQSVTTSFKTKRPNGSQAFGFAANRTEVSAKSKSNQPGETQKLNLIPLPEIKKKQEGGWSLTGRTSFLKADGLRSTGLGAQGQ